jgi:hypothetical protein
LPNLSEDNKISIMPTKVNPGDIPIAVGSSAGLEGAFDQANHTQVKEARNRCAAAFRDLLIPNDPGVAKVAIFKQ